LKSVSLPLTEAGLNSISPAGEKSSSDTTIPKVRPISGSMTLREGGPVFPQCPYGISSWGPVLALYPNSDDDYFSLVEWVDCGVELAGSPKANGVVPGLPKILARFAFL
jgi:hypothetical protein